MNGVFAEECGRLLPGLGAGVSPPPADLSTAAVFMLRLVPILSLPVVLPVFLFPNSSFTLPDFFPNHATHPTSQLSFIYPAIPLFQKLIRTASMPQAFIFTL